MDPATIAAAAGVISAGSSLAGTTIHGIVAGSDYNVVCGIQTENWTRYLLEKPKLVKNGGLIQNPPVEVMPGKKEVMLAHKVGHTACGTCGSVSWQIKDRRVVVMWSVPYDHNIYDNWLAVGITKPGVTDHDRNWFDIMYYKNDGWFKRGCFGQHCDPITFADSEFIVTGTMGSAHKTTVVIVVKPRREVDYCIPIKKACT